MDQETEKRATALPDPMPAPAEEIKKSSKIKLDSAQFGGSSDVGYVHYNGHSRSPGKFYSGTENPLTNSSAHRLNYDGRIYSSQMYSRAFFYLSDVAEKSNITPLENALDKLLSIKGVSFNWKDSGDRDSGVIAQQVAETIPEATICVDGKYSVNSNALIGYLIESIRQLKEEITELKNGNKD